MQIRKESEARRHENTLACVVYDYQLPTGELDSAVIQLSGRYPQDGWAVNTISTSVVYVLEGRGSLLSGLERQELAEGDQILIEKNEKYAFDGTMRLLYSAAPAWSPDQARNLP